LGIIWAWRITIVSLSIRLTLSSFRTNTTESWRGSGDTQFGDHFGGSLAGGRTAAKLHGHHTTSLMNLFAIRNPNFPKEHVGSRTAARLHDHHRLLHYHAMSWLAILNVATNSDA
jgi:hypothetical protein